MVIYDIKQLSMVDFIPWIILLFMLPGQLLFAYGLKKFNIISKVAFRYAAFLIVLLSSILFIRAVYKDHNLHTKNLKIYQSEYQQVESTINSVNVYRGTGGGMGHKDQVLLDKETLIVYTTSRGGCIGGTELRSIASKYKKELLEIHYIAVDEWELSSCIVFIKKHEE